jgi:hypothetical protein
MVHDLRFEEEIATIVVTFVAHRVALHVHNQVLAANVLLKLVCEPDHLKLNLATPLIKLSITQNIFDYLDEFFGLFDYKHVGLLHLQDILQLFESRDAKGFNLLL